MGEVRLSAYERRVLAEMEERLDRDESMARRLRTMRPRSRPLRTRRSRSRPLPFRAAGAHRRRPALVAAALAVAAVVLLVLAAATGIPALVWAFATVWALTVLVVFGAFVRWARRRTGEWRRGI